MADAVPCPHCAVPADSEAAGLVPPLPECPICLGHGEVLAAVAERYQARISHARLTGTLPPTNDELDRIKYVEGDPAMALRLIRESGRRR